MLGWDQVVPHTDKIHRARIKFGKGCKLLPQGINRVLIHRESLVLKQSSVPWNVVPSQGASLAGQSEQQLLG